MNLGKGICHHITSNGNNYLASISGRKKKSHFLEN